MSATAIDLFMPFVDKNTTTGSSIYEISRPIAKGNKIASIFFL
jgi:hypothetical protein